MVQILPFPAPQLHATTRRRSKLPAARAELARALDRAHAAYTFDASLRDAVDVLVAELRREGQSVEDVIDAVGASVRVIRPADTFSNDDAWERAWRSYFALYDILIQRAIRTFVIGSLEGDVRPIRAVAGQCTRCVARSPATRLSERSAPVHRGAAD